MIYQGYCKRLDCDRLWVRSPIKPKIIKFVFLFCLLPRDMNIDYDLSVGRHLCWWIINYINTPFSSVISDNACTLCFLFSKTFKVFGFQMFWPRAYLMKVIPFNKLTIQIQTNMFLIWIKFISDLRQIGGFLRVIRSPPPIKLTATI